jgi:signal transduction histidine kinase
VLRSTVLRLAIGYAALFVAAVAVLSAYVYWATAGYMARQTDKTIIAESDAMLERFRNEGAIGLARAIETRLAEEADEDEVLALVDPERRIVAGNLESVPSGTGDGLFDLELVRESRSSSARMLRLTLATNHQLFVGRDVQLRLDLGRLLAEALLWSIAITVALAILGGLMARRILVRRLQRISDVADRVVFGDLSHRVPLSGSGDEFDRLSQDINVMLERLSELMDGVREVSNSIAHDLRTPLTRLRGRLEGALAVGDSPARMREALSGAIREIDEVVRIFEALLRIAEIESGHRRAAFARVDLAEVASDVAELYQPLAEARGLALGVDTAPASCDGDRTLLAQAVANLVDNAIKYTPAGGRVTVAVARQPGQAVLTIADNGPGVPQGERDRIKERFYRLERSRSSPGSGLGLSLVVSVAKLHGGALTLTDNEPGLRASLTLPAAE